MNYYPGCSLHGSSREYDASVREVCRRMGWTLAELPDWNCCGAGAAAAADPILAQTLPQRNLILAEQLGGDLLVPCAACYNRLRQAHLAWERRMPAATAGSQRLEQVTGHAYGGGVRVLHLLDWWTQSQELAALKASVVRPLQGLPLAAYYGCLLLRPREVAFDDPEQPRRMEDLLTAMGARPVPWPGRLDCCGAGQAMAAQAMVKRQVDRLVAAARSVGARAIVTVCPMCQSNLESYQTGEGMPVLFLSEVVAGALGAEVASFLRHHLVSAEGVLADAG